MRKLLALFGFLTFLCLVAVGSYIVTLQVADKSGQQSAFLEQSDRDGQMVSLKVNENAQISASSSVRLIYGYETKSHEIIALILEVWNKHRQNLSYVTIPVDTGYTISQGLYRTLAVRQQTVPQMMRMSQLYCYYGEDSAWEYGVPVVEELLGVKITDYVALPKKELKIWFRQTKKGIWRYNKNCQELLNRQRQKLLEEDSDLDTLSEWRPQIWNNENLDIEEVSFYLVPGEEKNAGYVVNRMLLREQLSGVLSFISGN